MKKKPPPAKTEQPTSVKHETVRFTLGSLTKAKDDRVLHTEQIWSKEVQ